MAYASSSSRGGSFDAQSSGPHWLNIEKACVPSGASRLSIVVGIAPSTNAGYPWVAEASYVASVLPNVYLDVSELVPWGWGQIDWSLEMILGAVPGAKVFHGSDESSEPEMFPTSARLVPKRARAGPQHVRRSGLPLVVRTATERRPTGIRFAR